MDELDGADVDAARRLADEEHARVDVDFAGEHEFLLVAAREGGEAEAGQRGAHVMGGHLARAGGADGGAIEETAAIAVGPVVVAEDRVVLGGETRDDAHPQAVFGHVRETECAALTRTEVLAHEVVLLQDDRSARGKPDTGEGFEQLGLAVAGHAGDTHDLAGADREAHALHAGDAAAVADFEVADGEQRFAGLGGRFFDAQEHGTADHFLGEFARRSRGGGNLADHGALAHDGHAVGDGHDFAELVGDEDDGFPLVAQATQHLEQRVGFLRGQHGRGLVEDEDFGAAVEGLEDFHALLEADGQLGDNRVERDVERVVAGELFEFGPGAGETAGEEASALDTEDDVFEHREIFHEHEMLVHHADAGGDGGLRRTEVDAAAVHPNLAGVGAVKAVDDVHQRRLAGAVLTDEAVDAAAGDGKGNRAVGVDGAEALVDRAEFERGSRGRRGRGAGALDGHGGVTVSCIPRP